MPWAGGVQAAPEQAWACPGALYGSTDVTSSGFGATGIAHALQVVTMLVVLDVQ